MIRRALVLTLWVGAISGCGRCGGSARTLSEAELLSELPKKLEALAVVPDPSALGESVKRLERLKTASFAAQLQGFGNASEYADAAAAQLGFDPRSPQGLVEAGLAPRAPWAVASVSDGRGFALVQLSDEGRFEAAAGVWAERKLGAAQLTRSQEGEARLLGFSRTAGGPTALAVAIRGSLAWITGDSDGVALLRTVLSRPGGSLGDDATLRSRLGRLPSDRRLWVYLPPDSDLAPRLKGSLLAALRLDSGQTDAGLELVLDLPRAHETELAEGADTTHLIPAEAFLVARLGKDPGGLRTAWREAVGGGEARRLEQAGFDVERELFSNLKAGGWAALSLAPGVRLLGGMPSLDLRRTNPFRFVQLVGIVEPRDSKQSAETLKRLPSLGPALQARIEQGKLADREAYLTTYAQGEGIDLAQVDGQVLFGGPRAAVEALIRAGAGSAMKPQRLWRIPGDAGDSAVVLDLQRLSRSVRALPSEAWGVGGFAVRSSALRWLDAIDDFTAIEAVLSPREDHRRVSLKLRFAQL